MAADAAPVGAALREDDEVLKGLLLLPMTSAVALPKDGRAGVRGFNLIDTRPEEAEDMDIGRLAKIILNADLY